MNNDRTFRTSCTRRAFCGGGLASLMGLAACSTDKALEPLSSRVMADLQRLGLKVGAPVFIW